MITTLALFAIALGVSGWIGVAVVVAAAVKHLARKVLA